jgi:histidinol phosphatase-like enzyme (inositol monophosphatase family)
MNREPYQNLLAFAVEVAWRAGRSALAHYQTGVATETKPDASPVTAADRVAEQIARDLITTKFPHDGILGEEFGAVRTDANRRWILDPIDGTRTFVRGVPFFGCLLALEEAGEPVIGVMYFPALDETIYAARGEGCWWNGRRALVSDETELDRALILTSDVEDIERLQLVAGWNRVRSRAGFVRTWGDCYGHALVATGRAEAMFDAEMSLWDSAALRPIIEEAGGVYTDWYGNATHTGNSAIATNAALARDIRTLISDNA